MKLVVYLNSTSATSYLLDMNLVAHRKPGTKHALVSHSKNWLAKSGHVVRHTLQDLFG